MFVAALPQQQGVVNYGFVYRPEDHWYTRGHGPTHVVHSKCISLLDEAVLNCNAFLMRNVYKEKETKDASIAKMISLEKDGYNEFKTVLKEMTGLHPSEGVDSKLCTSDASGLDYEIKPLVKLFEKVAELNKDDKDGVIQQGVKALKLIDEFSDILSEKSEIERTGVKAIPKDYEYRQIGLKYAQENIPVRPGWKIKDWAVRS